MIGSSLIGLNWLAKKWGTSIKKGGEHHQSGVEKSGEHKLKKSGEHEKWGTF